MLIGLLPMYVQLKTCLLPLRTLTLCLVWVKIGRMENIGRKIGWKTVFFTIWQKKENREEGKPGRKFSLLDPQNSSSQIRRKMLERKVLSQHFYTNTSFYNQVKERKREREHWRKERERMRVAPMLERS